MKKALQILAIGAFGILTAKKVKEVQESQDTWKESTDSIKTQ